MSHPRLSRLFELLRAGVAGLAATLSDLAVLALLVSPFHVDPRAASLPALIAGGVVNFLGNRHFAFRAKGPIAVQAIGYAVVELFALFFNALLYDTVMRKIPAAAGAYWLVRLATQNLVFLLWSFPLWRLVFTWQPKARA